LSTLLVTHRFFFTDPPATEIHPLSLHDALPICEPRGCCAHARCRKALKGARQRARLPAALMARPQPLPWAQARSSGWPTSFSARSEEHTSELQSRSDLVCRLLLEKKKKQTWRR